MSESEGRRERKKRELRERIYETARALFLANGFEATTVEQIAEAADIAQTTFFNYFQSKAELLREMTNEVSDRLEAMLAEQLANPGTAEERIKNFVQDVVRQIDHAESLTREILLELMRMSSRPGEALPYLLRVYEPFGIVMIEGQEQGNVRRDFDAKLLAEMVIGTLHMALVGWLNDNEYPFGKRLIESADLLGELLRPPKMYRQLNGA
jgi:AcrR family transcriptional regulator